MTSRTSLDRISRLHPAYTSFHTNPDVQNFERLRELEALPATQRTPAQNDEIRGLTQLLGPVSPRERLDALQTRWSSESQPSKLQSYDIPVNKLAAVICFGFSVYLIALFIGVAIRTYAWDPASRTLTLPSGTNKAGLPLGLQLTGRWFSDEAMLSFAGQLEPIVKM